MRDMPIRKFQRAAEHMGFEAEPIDGFYTAGDGLRCAQGTSRRQTLAEMSWLRKDYPRLIGRRYTGALVNAASQNERAPGASTPGARSDQTLSGE